MTSRQELAMMALAQDLEQPGSDPLGQAFVNPDVVADRVSCRGDRGGISHSNLRAKTSRPMNGQGRRIVLSRPEVRPHVAGSGRLKELNITDLYGPRVCEPNRDVVRNALRGCVYAFFPSLILWAVMIWMIYSVVGR